MGKKIRLGILGFVILAGLVAFLTLLLTPKPSIAQISDYQISQKLAVNQSSYYPVQQTLDPQYYRPIDQWIGRLILPNAEEFRENANQDRDWAWLEIYQTPSEQKELVGKKVRLAWQKSTLLDRYLNLVTTDIKFTEAAKESEKQGNLLPRRLDDRTKVGPLQALAGARPVDDVLVSFPQAQIISNPEQTVIRVEKMPQMVTGRSVALVRILGEAKAKSSRDIPLQCPGTSPCPSELMQVQHYNPKTGQFDGLEEIIRIPQQPLVSGDRFISTPRQLADSPEGKAGWYLYGAQGQDGLFTAQSIQPRSLIQLNPTEMVFGQSSGKDYIHSGNWRNTPERRGTAQRVLVDPRSDSPEVALKLWKEGDRGLGIHLFGGIGGEKGETITGGTVTGHFSYFFPTVVRDRFTNELQWDITYYQVYAHNPQGILSGSQSWENYLGNLQRGWLNSRPVSNVIMKLDVLEDYNFGGITVSPLTELRHQLEVMMARYRTGDGTGSASVTPAASCVQDSNQALYITIEVLKSRISQDSAISSWLTNHPDDPQTQRFQRLVQLGDRLTEMLVPKGVIRPDWKKNAQTLAVVREDAKYSFVQKDTLANTLLSWQSMLPRVSHDVISQLFLEQGGSLWFLRTNQVGGNMPEILTLAPTNLFGEIPFISTTLRHILAALIFLPNAQGWIITFGLLLIYAAIAIPVGLKFHFLSGWQPQFLNPIQLLVTLIALFIKPAFWEELIFRVILLPYPDGSVSFGLQFVLVLLNIILFVGYHPLNALIFYKAGNPMFFNSVFLSLTALLGLTCAIAYLLTGSIWTIAVLHWIVVVIWLLGFNGLSRLNHPVKKDLIE